MSLLESFKSLFSKKEPEVIRIEKVKKVIGRNLSAKIKADIKKEQEAEEENEKEARQLISIKRKERIQKEKASKNSAKKKLKTLSSNF